MDGGPKGLSALLVPDGGILISRPDNLGQPLSASGSMSVGGPCGYGGVANIIGLGHSNTQLHTGASPGERPRCKRPVYPARDVCKRIAFQAANFRSSARPLLLCQTIDRYRPRLEWLNSSAIER